MKLSLIISCTMLAAATCTQAANKKDTHPHGIDPSNMDLKVKPGTDFYKFATGKWNDKYPMPAENSRYGIFNKLIDDNNKRIRDLISEMSKKTNKENSLEQKIGMLYNQVTDTKKLNEQGIAPLTKYVKMLEKISERRHLSQAIALMGRAGITTFFLYGTEADNENSKQNLVQIMQGGLTLGQRDYYLDTDEATMKIRNAYREFGQNVFKKLYPEIDDKEAQKRMNQVIALEARLAGSFKTSAALRVPENNYHKITIATLKANYPAINWDTFFKENKYAGFNEVNIGQPEALAEACSIIAEEPIEAIKNYLIFRLSEESFYYLSDDLRQLRFNFFGKVMSGTEQEQPAWKRGVNLVEGLLGEAVGKVYAEKYFPEAAKKRMETLVKNLQSALAERIQAQDWMSAETKQKALEKLGTFYVKIGYPDKWRDFSGLPFKAERPLLDNIFDITCYNSDYYTAKTVGKPVDRDQWYMTPQTVNAYYNPPTNEICFPAGILQYPFFDMQADDAFNYGAIGVVIGHEMTHGFDDQGRKYDKEGNMREWWSAADSKKFNERAQVIVDFFNNIKVLPDLHCNGSLTAGENLADHGGLQVAYTAFKNATRGLPQKKVNGFTPDQRFFIAFANVWAGSIREAEIRKRVKSDPHSLSEWRVNGSLPHIDAWYKAFNITPKDKLYIPKEKRVNIW